MKKAFDQCRNEWEWAKCKAIGLKECSSCKEVLRSKCSKKDCRKEGPPKMITVAGKNVEEKQSGSGKKVERKWKERDQHFVIAIQVKKMKWTLI